MTTVQAINDAAESIGSTLSALSARLSSSLREGAYTTRDLRHIRATLAGVLADRGDLRAIIDPLDVDTLLLGDNAADTVRLWIWLAQLRKALGTVAIRAIEAGESAQALERGVDHTVHIVRSGETLQSIAAKRLGSWMEWRRLAEANGLSPGVPPTGAVLIIPALR